MVRLHGRVHCRAPLDEQLAPGEGCSARRYANAPPRPPRLGRGAGAPGSRASRCVLLAGDPRPRCRPSSPRVGRQPGDLR
jgi:hypothetical protein